MAVVMEPFITALFEFVLVRISGPIESAQKAGLFRITLMFLVPTVLRGDA